jgi:hypothetical protein
MAFSDIWAIIFCGVFILIGWLMIIRAQSIINWAIYSSSRYLKVSVALPDDKIKRKILFWTIRILSIIFIFYGILGLIDLLVNG